MSSSNESISSTSAHITLYKHKFLLFIKRSKKKNRMGFFYPIVYAHDI